MILGPQGRVVIPSEYRKALGVGPGDTLVVWLEGDRIVLRRRQAVEQELWGLMANVDGSLSAELLSERRRAADGETQE
jgi:AbrB family looped-hinge helix DNA binding protein